MTPVFARSLCVLALVTVVACAPRPNTHWTKDGDADSKMSADLRYCRAESRKEVERLYAHREARNTYELNMRTYEAREAEKKMVAQCMAKFGYKGGR
ncbi:MAG: hypothetical protein ACPGO3_16205 [Magnetospiraceae bacterium]